MPNNYSTPITYPKLADASAGAPFRARLMDSIGEAQNASYALALRGGMSQSFSGPLSTSTAAGYSQALEWRVPVWPGVNSLSIGMRHLASSGGYGFRKDGDAAPAVTNYGAGKMAWNSQAHTATTYDASAETDYFDLQMLLNDSADLHRVSIGHGVVSVATSQYSDGFEGFGTIAQADAGASALYHQAVGNLAAQAATKTCWSAWSAPDSTNVTSHTLPLPMLGMPVWCPGRVRDSRVVRVWVKLARSATEASGRVDIRIGTPNRQTSNRRWGRVVDSLSTASAIGEWLTTTFEIPPGYEIMPGLPGGYVHVDTVNHVVDATIQSISVWMEPES